MSTSDAKVDEQVYMILLVRFFSGTLRAVRLFFAPLTRLRPLKKTIYISVKTTVRGQRTY